MAALRPVVRGIARGRLAWFWLAGAMREGRLTDLTEQTIVEEKTASQPRPSVASMVFLKIDKPAKLL